MMKDNTTSQPLVDFGPVEDKSKGIIKVIGVGGGGCNAVRNMYNEGIEGVTLAVCNTDSKSLAPSPVPVKIMLGEGLGAGGVPEIGRSEAEKNVSDIEKLLNDGTRMVFITASMGGGTGTGSAPVVASVAKKMGLLTIGVVTIPFYFEKKQKIIKALKGVDELKKNVDALLIINNERLCDVYGDTPIAVKESFARADNILKDAVKGIAELITVNSEGGIDLDFRDVETTMRNGGGAIMATGKASGEKRVERAILNAIDSPLLYGNDIGKAKRILFNIYSSDEAPIMVPEMQEIDDFFDQLDPNIEVIWGISTDASLGGDAKVTILATGMEDEKDESEKLPHDDRYYEELIPKLYKPIVKQVSNPKEEPVFVIEPIVEPEPAKEEPVAAEEPEHEEEPMDKEEEQAGDKPGGNVPMIDKWKKWLNGFIQDTDNED
ncbi:MAG: cell division protein FtsZ [Prevotella sp.]|uniref:cell division protein FtsZ n=1 Tax=Prevotella sp. Rep29 TaxID=2691580 RepID=UPI001C6F06A4|nr:cell division protein FtsZ [Prevotella sp. Rep29]MBR1656014.1 cell division protein FtsZ [Prevotella sp.]MBR3389256.1 cell division protein FtsZ [Prevotella sp.]MBR3445855.1 cell division protein FtsZ [Prevotella sp.]MBR7093706.1 cell division protein FtsZ [Prevotella sp.]QYR10751.1 cell division protein FtsZ [Prevotella sp. Rep29]